MSGISSISCYIPIDQSAFENEGTVVCSNLFCVIRFHPNLIFDICSFSKISFFFFSGALGGNTLEIEQFPQSLKFELWPCATIPAANVHMSRRCSSTSALHPTHSTAAAWGAFIAILTRSPVLNQASGNPRLNMKCHSSSTVSKLQIEIWPRRAKSFISKSNWFQTQSFTNSLPLGSLNNLS